jgi:hypothetical protein
LARASEKATFPTLANTNRLKALLQTTAFTAADLPQQPTRS